VRLRDGLSVRSLAWSVRDSVTVELASDRRREVLVTAPGLTGAPRMQRLVPIEPGHAAVAVFA
jgi:hypothetical protein